MPLHMLLEHSFKYNFTFFGEYLVGFCTMNSGGKTLSAGSWSGNKCKNSSGDLGWKSAMGRERRGLEEAQNRMLSEKRKSSKSPSIYSSKGREN